jgi:hypothetical protein
MLKRIVLLVVTISMLVLAGCDPGPDRFSKLDELQVAVQCTHQLTNVVEK